MSLKTDLLAVGAFGVGAYFIFVNRDKIMEWLGQQVFAPAAAAYEATGQNVGATIGGAATGETGAAVGGAIGAANQYVSGNPIVGAVSGGIAGTIWPLFVNPFQAKPIELPKTVVVDGLGYSGTPEFLTQKITSSSSSAPYNPGLNVIPIVAVSTPAPAPALTAAQQYAKNFAMPGSQAWIAAGL